jgi:hypothetical protein
MPLLNSTPESNFRKFGHRAGGYRSNSSNESISAAGQDSIGPKRFYHLVREAGVLKGGALLKPCLPRMRKEVMREIAKKGRLNNGAGLHQKETVNSRPGVQLMAGL